MPPKKRAADSTDPQPTSSKVSAEETAGTEISGAAAVRKRAAHPTTAIMVREALKDLDSRKGVSSQAIQSFIKQKYPSADGVRLKHLVRTALKKGIETGALVRPVNSSVTTGVLGKFRLAPEKQPKAKIENTDPNVQKVPKAAKDGVKRIQKAEGSKKSSAKEESAEKPPSKKSKKAGEAASSNALKAAKDGVEQIQTTEDATKKSSAEEVESAENEKPPKKSKKAGVAASSKVAPAKKPKAKGSIAGNSDSTKSKATKVTKGTKTGKAAQSKAAEAGDDAPALKAAGKRGKKME